MTNLLLVALLALGIAGFLGCLLAIVWLADMDRRGEL